MWEYNNIVGHSNRGPYVEDNKKKMKRQQSLGSRRQNKKRLAIEGKTYNKGRDGYDRYPIK